MKKERERKPGGIGGANSGLPRGDRALKDFLSDNEVFADLINAILFDGECVVQADDFFRASRREQRSYRVLRS